MKWYMVRSVNGKEEQAIQNLKSEIALNKLESYVGEVFCPKDRKFYMRNNKKVEREKVMFPGYFVMQANLVGELPKVVKQTNLVSQIMGNSMGPEAVPLEDINRIKGNVEKAKEEIKYLIGEEINITDGPFKNFKGTIREINKEKERAVIDVVVFGNPTPVELNYVQIDKVKY